MKSIVQVVLVCIVSTLATLLITLRMPRHISSNDIVSVSNLQIVDDHGRPRLSLSTDSDGKAKIEFISPDHKQNSIIEQFRDGNILLQLAGAGQRPSVSLTTDFQLGGPSLIMRGIGDHQTLLLGFSTGDTIAPSQPVSSWGLLFPGMRAHEQFAGIGVSQDPASKILKGFVFPIGRQVGTQE